MIHTQSIVRAPKRDTAQNTTPLLYLMVALRTLEEEDTMGLPKCTHSDPGKFANVLVLLNAHPKSELSIWCDACSCVFGCVCVCLDIT
jgi:hypothetical protein